MACRDKDCKDLNLRHHHLLRKILKILDDVAEVPTSLFWIHIGGILLLQRKRTC
jgi:hypothetical protein